MESSTQTTGEPSYPVRLSVEYPDRELNRLTTAFRVIVAIPILIVAATLGDNEGTYRAGEHSWRVAGGTGGLLFLAPLLMIVFRQKYPRWWFDWNLELLRFSNRIGVYLALMDDRYPSTDERQGVVLDFPYPDAEQELNRWLPLVKWLLAIPHYILLVFLSIGALVAVVIAWFAILFTGRYPRGLFEFVLGVLRDKDAAGIVAPLLGRAARLVLTKSTNPRAAAPEDLRAIAPAALPVASAPSVSEALALAEGAEATPILCVAGSLSLVGDALAEIGGNRDKPCPVENAADSMGALS